MPHPRDQKHYALTRQQLLRGAAAATLGAGAIATLAGCEDTTTARGASETGAGRSRFVVEKPTGPDGLPLPRPDNSVTWALTDDNPMVDDGRRTEGGTLQIYNYADYVWPGLLKAFSKRYNCQV